MPYYSSEDFRPQISLGYLIRRVNKLASARLDAILERGGVTLTQWIVLALVSNGIATTCRDLSRNMDHNSGALTRVIDQLEERGLLERTRDDADRRVSNLTVTAPGRRVLQDNAALVVDFWNEVIDGFDPDEITRTIALLARLVDRLETSGADVPEA